MKKLTEFDFWATWTIAIIIIAGIVSVIIVSLYHLVLTMESEHEFGLSDEEHLKEIDK